MLTIPRDKVLHFLGGAFLQSVFTILGMPYYKSLITVTLIAAGKELYDKLHPDKHTADILDAAATILGGVVAMGVLALIL